jgi:transposase
MKKVLKRVVGIDVDLNLLVCCFGEMYEDTQQVIISHKTFANSKEGFVLLLAYISKMPSIETRIRFVFEATGVYHENLAYFLAEQGLDLSIILPTKISNFARTLQTKTITDKTSSEAIMFFALGRNLENWVVPSPIYREFQQLTRERQQIIAFRSIAKNRLHAERSGANANAGSIKRLEIQIKLFNDQEKEINKEINKKLKEHKTIKKSVELLCTIPGIGILTAVTILAETNGFNLIRNKKQLASYAGFDVKQKQSGTSVKGKEKISKQGNTILRAALHFPALTAKRHDERYNKIQEDIYNKTGIKMKGYVAIQRRLLEMCYTIYKTNVAYDPNYETKKQIKKDKIMELA